MIVADTGAIIALIDRDDKHHAAMVGLFEQDPSAWVLPWAILPEVDYLLQRCLGDVVATSFMADLSSGAFVVEWGDEADMTRAFEIRERYRALQLGLVDSVVAAIAERLRATAIATVKVRTFSAMKLMGSTKLYPRDNWLGSMQGTATITGDLISPLTPGPGAGE